MSETVILIRCHAPAIRPRRTTTAGASVLVRVSCADISLSHLLVPGRGSRPSGTRFPRPARSAAGVEIPHLPGGRGGGWNHPHPQTRPELSASLVRSARRRHPVLSLIRSRCVLTVRTLMYICAAICASVRPRATSVTSSRSRGLSFTRPVSPAAVATLPGPGPAAAPPAAAPPAAALPAATLPAAAQAAAT